MIDDYTAWEFDHFKVMVVLADIIEEMVGEHLAVLPKSGGKKAVYLAHYNGIQPPLSNILLTYQGSRDSDGVVIAGGLVDVSVEDPDNPPTMVTITTPYSDKLTNFSISLRCESLAPKGLDDKTNSHRLMREVRKGLLLPKYRKKLRDEVFTVLEFINPIRSTPDLLSTSYHEICTMQLKLSTVDRQIDYNSGSFGSISYNGELKTHVSDTDIIVINNIVP